MKDLNKIFLGTLIENNEKIYITKHKWDCDWYWSFGYVGNSSLHFHFNAFLQDSDYYSDLFKKHYYTDDDWWAIRDLFKQAYALKACAEIYQYGGHQTSESDISDLIQSKEKANQLNADLKIVLDKVWEILIERRLK